MYNTATQTEPLPKHSLKVRDEANDFTWETSLYSNMKILWTGFESAGMYSCVHASEHA